MLRGQTSGVSQDLTQIWDEKRGFNLLHLAAAKNNLKIVRLLCEFVIDSEISNSN